MIVYSRFRINQFLCIQCYYWWGRVFPSVVDPHHHLTYIFINLDINEVEKLDLDMITFTSIYHRYYY